VRRGLLSHSQIITDDRVRPTFPDNPSNDTVILASLELPPPVYIHPPGYNASFTASNTMEQGAYNEHAGL
jgi:hypothetical protein